MKKAWFLSALALIALCAVPARANTITYQAILSGPAESPPNASPGTGLGIITIDDVANTMRVQVTFADLVTTGTGTTASHIHCCTAAPGIGTAIVATQTPTFTGFPLGVRSGTLRPYVRPRVGLELESGVHHREWQQRGLSGGRVSHRSGQRHGLSEHPLKYVRGRRNSWIRSGGAGAGDDFAAWSRALESGVDRETLDEVDSTPRRMRHGSGHTRASVARPVVVYGLPTEWRAALPSAARWSCSFP